MEWSHKAALLDKSKCLVWKESISSTIYLSTLNSMSVSYIHKTTKIISFTYLKNSHPEFATFCYLILFCFLLLGLHTQHLLKKLFWLVKFNLQERPSAKMTVCVYLKCSVSPLKFEMKAAVESGQVPCSLSPSSGQTENRRPVPFWSVMFDIYLLFSFAQWNSPTLLQQIVSLWSNWGL